MPSHARRWLAMFGYISAFVLFVACGPGTVSEPSQSPAPPGRLNVVATNTVLADLARQVGGNLVEVVTIVPAGADVHTFQPTPANSKAISEARVIISNGMGFDDFLNPMLESGSMEGSVWTVAARDLELDATADAAIPLGNIPTGSLVPINAVGQANGSPTQVPSGVGPQSDQLVSDEGNPHFWLNPMFAAAYVERIRDGLIQADPDHRATYSGNAEKYLRELGALDEELAQTLNQVPAERRHLISYHDAYVHFANRYGWRTSFLVPDDASEPTPEDIVRLMEAVIEGGIPAVFMEQQLESDIMRAAAQDAGVNIGTIRTLVDDDVPDYLTMMRSNTKSLVEALR